MRASLIAGLLLFPAIATAQQSVADRMAASFTKQKHVIGKKYKDVRAEPAIRAEAGDYAGRYEVSGLDSWIEFRVGADGRLQGSGYDAGPHAGTFELKDATIAGAVLTATKVYRDGTVARLEGVFVNRTQRLSPSDPGETTFGLGVTLHTPVHTAGGTFERLFYQLKN